MQKKDILYAPTLKWGGAYSFTLVCTLVSMYRGLSHLEGQGDSCYFKKNFVMVLEPFYGPILV